MNTLENNKKIAQFMGLTQGRPNETRWKHDWFDDKGAINGVRNTHLLFNTDWNWLMPVVEKIESMGFCFDIMGKACSISRHNEMIVDLNGNDFDKKIDSVYFACVDFLEWYTTV